MSRLWTFDSYNPARFAAYFDGSVPDAAWQVVEAATWEDGIWRDTAVPARLADRITTGGIRYDGLSPTEAEALDLLLPLLVAPEGLADRWEVTPESPDGLDPSVIRELLPLAGDAALLPVLVSGRRFGATEPFACNYCFLSLAECERLAGEAERALASDGSWSRVWVPEVVGECLIDPLRSTVSKGRALFGVLG